LEQPRVKRLSHRGAIPRRGHGHERTSLSERKPRVPRRTHGLAQGRAGPRRQGESRGRETPQTAPGRAIERREAREVLRAVRGQERAAALLLDVRPELGQALSVLYVADGWVDRTWYSVAQNAAFATVAKAPAQRINAWAKERGWSQIPLLSGSQSTYQADYKCQGDTDDMQLPVMHAFAKRKGKIFHFWGTESMMNHVDTVWPYWNLMDFTPDGRPDVSTPPQKFRSKFLEKHYLNKE
jgi:Bacterial protein of unknown function (DUF899)